MPVLKHAKKKLRQDKVRTARNKKLKDLFKKLVKQARAKKTAESVSKAFSSIDKAAKNYILHKKILKKGLLNLHLINLTIS